MRVIPFVLLLGIAQASRWDPPGQIPHLESTPKKLRAEIDALVAVLVDVNAGKDSLDAKERLAAIGRPAFPRILAAMARLTDTIGDDDTPAERLVESSLHLADKTLREMDGYLDVKGKSAIRPGSEKRYIKYILRLHYKRWIQKLKPGVARAAVSVHAFGVYVGGDARIVLKEVAGPVILVLTSYEATRWKIENPAGVEIVGVFVSGYHTSSVTGVPDGTKVVVRSYDNGARDYFYWRDSYPGKRDDFKLFRNKERIRYNQFVAKIERLTGHKPQSVHGRYHNSDFELRIPARRPVKFDVHAIGVYEQPKDAPIQVSVAAGDQPVFLVLTSSTAASWKLQLAAGAKLAGVILGGYEDQEVEGLPDGVLLLERGFCVREYRQSQQYLEAMVEDLTGQKVKTLQTAYKGVAFTVK